MAPSESLANRINSAPRTTVSGRWMRHVPIRYRAEGLVGLAADGRWSRRNSFPVLYLGRPVESVTVEAYRHLVDKSEGMRPELVAPRALFTCDVEVSNILDLRTAGGRATAGLDLATLQSLPDDKLSYEACREVASAAHQLGLYGLVAPAATNLGETLVLFTDLLPEDEWPQISAESEWEHLPPDPRGKGGLRLVRDP